MRANRNLLLGCLTLGWSVTGHAGDPFMSGPAPRGPQIMIYFRQPLGNTNMPRVYGLRLDRTSVVSGSPVPAAAAIRRREILDFELGSRGDMHVTFGRRLYYDIGSREFALSPHSTITLSLPSSLRLKPTAH